MVVANRGKPVIHHYQVGGRAADCAGMLIKGGRTEDDGTVKKQEPNLTQRRQVAKAQRKKGIGRRKSWLDCAIPGCRLEDLFCDLECEAPPLTLIRRLVVGAKAPGWNVRTLQRPRRTHSESGRQRVDFINRESGGWAGPTAGFAITCF
jgi:hypothetical protein